MTEIVAQSGVKLPSVQVSRILNGGQPLSEMSWAEWFFSFFSQLLKHKTTRSELESIYQKINIYADDDSDITKLEKLDNYLTLMQLTKHEHINNYNLVYTKRTDDSVDVDFRYQDNSLFIMTISEDSVTYETIGKIFNNNGKLMTILLREHTKDLKCCIKHLMLDEVYNKKNEDMADGSMQCSKQHGKATVDYCFAQPNIELLNEICGFLLEFDDQDKSKVDYRLKFNSHSDYSFIKHQVIPEVYRAELLVNGERIYGKVKQIQKEVFDIIKDEFIQQQQLVYCCSDMSLVVFLNDRMNASAFIERTKDSLIKFNSTFLSSSEPVCYDVAHLNSIMPIFISNRVNRLIINAYGACDYFSDRKIKFHDYTNNGELNIKTLSVLGDELCGQVGWLKDTVYPILFEYCSSIQYPKMDIYSSLVDKLGLAIGILHSNIENLQNEIRGYKQQYEKESVFFLEKNICYDLSLKIKKMVKNHQVLCEKIQELSVM